MRQPLCHNAYSSKPYYPFGMIMPGRSYTATSAYRFGFNGKEKDDEDDLQDYGMRMYDPRLGKFASADPLAKKYPWNSTYAFAENDVIRATDLDGKEKNIEVWIFNDAGIRKTVITLDKSGKLGDGTLIIYKSKYTGTTIQYIAHHKDIIDKIADVFDNIVSSLKNLNPEGHDQGSQNGGTMYTSNKSNTAENGPKARLSADQMVNIDDLIDLASTAKSTVDAEGSFTNIIKIADKSPQANRLLKAVDKVKDVVEAFSATKDAMEASKTMSKSVTKLTGHNENSNSSVWPKGTDSCGACGQIFGKDTGGHTRNMIYPTKVSHPKTQ